MSVGDLAQSSSTVLDVETQTSAGPRRPPNLQCRTVIPTAMLVVAGGVLLVVLAYVRSRAGLDHAGLLLWSGTLLIFGFVVVRILMSSTAPRDRAFLAVLFAASQTVLRWAYSPHEFTFSDELQHLRSLLNVLTTHHLFERNDALPISPQYPGLENVTTELAQVSSMSPFVAGVLVATVAHILTATALLLLFGEVSASSRVVCLAVVLYLLNPHAAYFDTSFLYETLALPFVVMAVFLAIRFARRCAGSGRHFLGMVACCLMVTLTHHVSVLATVGLIGGIAAAAMPFAQSRSWVRRLMLCAAAAAAVFAGWVFFFAPSTVAYLSGPADQLLDALHDISNISGDVDLPTYPTPLFDRMMSPLGVLVTLALLLVSLRSSGRRPALERCFVWAAVGSYGLVLVTRLVVSNGAELSSRMMTFTTLFTALALALAFDTLLTASAARHTRAARGPYRMIVATALAIVLLLSSVVTSLPEWWQRLPGRFWVDAFASGIDSVGTSRATWAASHLSPGARYFGDTTSAILLSTYAQLDPIQDPGSLYYTAEFTAENLELVRNQSAVYLDVDLRMAKYPPVRGLYFPVDIEEGERRSPIDPAALLKFDTVRGISRIYDSGFDRMYDLRWVQR
jgi:hypothetical protein